MDGLVLEQIRNSLLDRWRRIGKSGGSDIDADTTPSAELIDIAQALEQIGRDTSLKEAERRELLAIERALAKIATGSFGVCEDCGDEIAPKRLMVLPEARLCTVCQTYEEKQNSKIVQKPRAAS